MTLRASALLCRGLLLLGFVLSGPDFRGHPLCADEQQPVYRLATFQADVSPPLGKQVDIGFRKETVEIEHPALLKGILLEAGTERYVLAAIDYSGLCNDSHLWLRQRLAEGAETQPEFVALQAVHQHTTVCLDANAAALLYADQPELLQGMRDFEEEIGQRVAGAVRAARSQLRPVRELGVSRGRVEQVASNRRLPLPDGRIQARMSSTRDPQLQALPEGNIDPWLRTITFYGDAQPLAQLHYYATHPQSYYGDQRCTWDVPGIARERLQQETGVFQVYFTGCAGDVAMGKYNEGTPEARALLAERLYQGMRASLKSIAREPAQPLFWKSEELTFPLREAAPFTAEACRQVLQRPDAPFGQRLKAAMCAAWIDRVAAGFPVQACSLQTGSLRLLHLPGEPFVMYQQFAQSHRPDHFVCVAGYGDCAMWYLGPDHIYTDQGGYEQSWSFAGPCEALLRRKIKRLLETP